MSRNILLLTQNFPPDIGAPSFRMEAFARELASRGYQVNVLTAYPNRYRELNVKTYDDFGSNIKVTRIKNIKQSSNLVRRAYSYIDYFIKAFFVALRMRKDCDMIIATSPQILTGYLGALVKSKEKPFLLDVRDLWPDAMLDLGLATESSIIYRILKKIEIYIYKKASVIIINSPAFEEDIRRYVDKRIELVMNGLDDSFYELINKSVPKTHTPGEKIVVTYAGNLGIGQDVKILTKLNRKVSQHFVFKLIGSGPQSDEILEVINKDRITNIKVFPPRARNELVSDYTESDAFFVHLKNIPMFAKTIPSKIFEYVATRKPVVYGLSGVSKEIMDELNAGYSFEPGNVESLEDALMRLKSDIEDGTWKYNENPILKEKYLRSSLSKKFADIVEEVLSESNKQD